MDFEKKLFFVKTWQDSHADIAIVFFAAALAQLC